MLSNDVSAMLASTPKGVRPRALRKRFFVLFAGSITADKRVHHRLDGGGQVLRRTSMLLDMRGRPTGLLWAPLHPPAAVSD